MRFHSKAVVTVLALLPLCLWDGQSAKPLAGGEETYRVVHGWPVVPDNEMLDEVSAVAVDGNDNVLVLTRAGRKWPDADQLDTTAIRKPTIFLFDGKSGRLLNRWGAGVFALPHSITVDGRGNIWVADVALHQIFKFSATGKLLMALGARGKSGEDAAHFNRPSDVAIAPDGSIFVSDGYGNNRVVKFDASGKFLLAWGSKGSGIGQFDLPHGIAIDNQSRVLVSDRKNARIQLFDGNGRFLSAWKGPPFVMPQDVKVGRSGRAYVVESGNEAPPDESGILVLGPDGSLIERIGRYGNYDGQFVDPHWVAVDSYDTIYVADFEGRRVQKFVVVRGQD
jgi:peptidylamidoglycolate lyase